MADRFLLVIPADPKAALPQNAYEIRDALAQMSGTDEARVKDYGKLQFIDAGSLARSVTCPACRNGLSTSDWRAWMDQDWHGEDGFHLHERDAPCCGTKMALNELIYDAPQGFARWFVSARQGMRGPLSVEETEKLEDIAGMRLTALAQQY